MKVYVLVVDTKTGISQNGMIEEPMLKEAEVANALKHFGVFISEVDWYSTFTEGEIDAKPKLMQGRVRDTTKVVSVVVI